MKRVLLGSHGIGALPDLVEAPTDGLRVAYVPTAAGPEAESQPWVQVDRRQLEHLGCDVVTLELVDAEPAKVAATLGAVSAVFVTGGSAHLVLWHAHQSGFSELVPPLVESGDLIYVGTSSGAILAGPNVEPAIGPEGRADAPELSSTAALALVEFSILPHDQMPKRHALNFATLEHGHKGFVVLRDDQAVLVRDESRTLVDSPVLA